MKIGIVIVSTVVFLMVAVFFVGLMLPQSHVASRTVSFHQPVEKIWGLISDFSGQVKWRIDLKSVEFLPQRNKHVTIKEIDKEGGSITYEIVEFLPQKKLVRKISDEALPFGGTWTLEVKPLAEGSALTIVENGEVYNPIFRFVSRFVIGHTESIDKYVQGLQNANFSVED